MPYPNRNVLASSSNQNTVSCEITNVSNNPFAGFMANVFHVVWDSFQTVHRIVVKHFSCLKLDGFFETPIFNADNFQWRLVIYRCFDHYGAQTEKLHIALRSYNSTHLNGQFFMKVHNNRLPKYSLTRGWKSCIVPAFSSVMDFHIEMAYHVFNPVNGLIENDQLTISVDIRDLTPCEGIERPYLGNDMRLINLEIFSDVTIEHFMKQNKTLNGVLPLERKRADLISANGPVKLFGENEKYKKRYWLCMRKGNNQVAVKGCTSALNPHLTFRNIATIQNNNTFWVTLFEEEEEGFGVSDDAILIFVKIYDPLKRELKYLGHKSTRSDRPFAAFISEFVSAIRRIGKYETDVYIEKEESVKKIDGFLTSLAYNRIESGSVLVLRPRNPGDSISEETVQQELSVFYQKKPPNDQNGEGQAEGSQGPKIPLCVACNEAPRTSGFIHGDSSHTCVCENCARRIMATKRLRCPICRQPAEQIILKMF